MGKAAATRLDILQKAFELIYANGYQATSVDDILATTKVTKGAFYYHFKNKDEMGLAVIHEVMFPAMGEAFTQLSDSTDPLKDIYGLMKHFLLETPALQVQYGCPAGNLAHELPHISDAFNTAMAELVNHWREGLQACISNGKKAGLLRSNINPQQVAYFIMAGYWGIRNYAKLYNTTDSYVMYLKELKQYLNGLKK
jgi:TetR/AcrR family transcriptional regulator, transcriptional repressor for nem operon